MNGGWLDFLRAWPRRNRPTPTRSHVDVRPAARPVAVDLYDQDGDMCDPHGIERPVAS